VNDRGDQCAEPAPGVVTIPATLVADLRQGVLRMVTEVGLEISVLAEQEGEFNAVENLLQAFRRLDALRALLNNTGLTRGVRAAPVLLTEADHPDLALQALELEYRGRLTRVEDAEHSGFTASTRRLAELGQLVAALRDRLDADSHDAP
jgi:hypothetical protein